MKRLLLLLVIAGFTSGCWTVRMKAPRASGAGEQTQKGNLHFLWGLTGADIDATQCTNGVSEIQFGHPWYSFGCLGALTGGIVTATKTQYVCAEAGSMKTTMGDLPKDPPKDPPPGDPPPDDPPDDPPDGAMAAKPANFMAAEKIKFKLVKLPEGVTFDQAFDKLAAKLGEGYTLGKMDKTKGLLLTKWDYTMWPDGPEKAYRVRVYVRFSGDKKKFGVKAQAMHKTGEEWAKGQDTALLEKVVAELTAAVAAK